MKETPAILLIGAGRWGMNHLRAWMKLQAAGLCRLVGVQDSDADRRDEVAKEYGIKTFADDSGLAQADAVDIVVPTYAHFEVAKKALSAGKDVMVEKPVTMTLAEARELEALKKKTDRVFLVGHLFRYNPAADYARKLIVEGEIGKVRFLRGRFMGFRFQEHDAGILATTAIHFLYLSDFFMGRPADSVWAKTEHMLGNKLDDLALIRLGYDAQFSIVESDYFTPGKWRTFDIIGTQGSIAVDLLNQRLELHRKRHVRTGERFEAYDGGVIRPEITFQEPLELELRHFLKCVGDRSEPMTPISDGRDAVAVVEAAYQSAETGKTVRLN
ncbi:MAG: Gfo/Idh/MocA family oxidoreductase [Elusimicrobia bacterium]|nr:Gfo/Idh/MocA family oxidoreductase [Elusimicrobiota bacterium]